MAVLIGFLVAAGSRGTVLPVLLFPLMIVALIYFFSKLNLARTGVEVFEPQDQPTQVYHFNPDPLKDVRAQHQAVLSLLHEHGNHPVVMETRLDIEREAATRDRCLAGA